MRTSAILTFVALLITAVGCHQHDHITIVQGPGAQAQTGEVGNGGSGVEVGSKIYTYDLWEAGLEKTPVDTEDTVSHSNAANVEAFFNRLFQSAFGGDRELVSGLANRLGKIYVVDPILSMAIAESIRAYEWRFTEQELKEIALPEPEVIHNVSREKIVQIAVRSSRFIYVYLKYWRSMDNWNRVGLILHEAIYSLLPPQKVLLADGEETMRQSGKRARQITAVLMGSVPLSRLDYDKMQSHVNPGELPLSERKSDPMRGDYTATFIDDLSPLPDRSHTADRVSLLGLAVLAVAMEDGVGSVLLPLDQPVENTPALVEEFCKAAVKFPEKKFDVLLYFPGEPKANTYELKFATYQEGNIVKDYLVHRKREKPDELRLTSGSGSDLFEVAGHDEAKSVAKCQETLKTITAWRENLFPQNARALLKEKFEAGIALKEREREIKYGPIFANGRHETNIAAESSGFNVDIRLGGTMNTFNGLPYRQLEVVVTDRENGKTIAYQRQVSDTIGNLNNLNFDFTHPRTGKTYVIGVRNQSCQKRIEARFSDVNRGRAAGQPTVLP